MPQETDRLKLPLPLGNENVNRESINGIFEKIDAGVATLGDLDTLREAVSKMDIPDASLTQKGKVQLSSKTDGTSETVAATERAVRDARVAAINVATTDATANAKSYIDTKTWQKHKLTADDGKSQLVSGTDLNSLVANGQYNGNSLTNAPIPANVDEWWYIDVQCHSNGSGYVIQRASRLNGGTQTLYQRTRENNIWQPWSLDVFQSGVDAKNGIVGAINAKGGSASTSDPWATLVSKINGIEQGYYQYLPISLPAGGLSLPGGPVGAYGPVVATIPAGTKLISIQASSDFFYATNTDNNKRVALVLMDGNGVMWAFTVAAYSGNGELNSTKLHSAQLDLVAGVSRSQKLTGSLTYQHYTNEKPANFNANTTMQIRIGLMVAGTGTSNCNYSFYGNIVSV
ncbi:MULTISPECIES: tail fiber protein [Paenibacillus]|uniref:tail fiber protein n=1 Tax=Paenibacillus TaxID=44249 RepID=UPI00129D9BDA|nr:MULTISPECIES: tail fiber protein [Paenibacillus]MBE7681091.1 hypothetical protein [Paenibacillus sp. P13VS]